ncbi:DUF3618 domain-containing protein [Streptomyces sp. NPDC006458]|uniref:DUF3618 domain-containing protein n=1 Tax=Streptomyces sp. NPDC006458 TaxID=3154302 RepID=UPI0033B701BE
MNQPSQDGQSASSDELREQVEEVRGELGRTVQALAAKTDVQARARQKAAEVRQQAAAKAGQLRTKAADVTHVVEDKVAHPVKDKAGEVSRQARAKTAQAGHLIGDKMPEPVRRTAARGAPALRGRRTVVLTAVAGGAVLVWLVCRPRSGKR